MLYRVLIREVNPNSLIKLEDNDIPLNSFYDAEHAVWKVVYLSPEEEPAEDESAGKKLEEGAEGE